MDKNNKMSQVVLPMDLSKLFHKNDMVRFVDQIVESIPANELLENDITSLGISYHPKKMLKIILFAYTQSIYNAKDIEAALGDSIRLMWLAQEQKPTAKEINRFRKKENMSNLLKSIFINFRIQLITQGLINKDDHLIDYIIMKDTDENYKFKWYKDLGIFEDSLVEQSRKLYEEIENIKSK